jgi:hypothetical protein
MFYLVVSMAKEVENLRIWREKKLKDASGILEILEICHKYHANSLEPILNPVGKITTASVSVKAKIA